MLPKIPLPRRTKHFGRHVVGTLLGAQSFLRGASLRWRDGAVRPETPMRILVRYSVFMPGSAGWTIGRDRSASSYRAALFDPARLAFRLRLLRGLLLPSLAGQSLPMRKGLRELVIFISEELPADHRAELESTISPFGWIRIHPLPASARRFPPVGPVEPHLSLRIDDDDALSRDFLARLSAYFRPDCAGHAITFPAGYLLRLRDSAPPGFALIWRPKLAIGLAYYVAPGTRFSSILDLANHNRVDREAPTIFGDAAPAWLRSIYDGQDSADYRRNLSDPRIALARVQRDFDFDPARLTLPLS